MAEITVTIPSFTITLPEQLDAAHTCDPTCGCPAAVARAQLAIDTDRAEHGAPARSLRDRVAGMRNAAPPADWFDQVARDVDVMQDQLDRERAHTAAANRRIIDLQAERRGARGPLNAMLAAVSDALYVLRLAELLPASMDYAPDETWERARLYIGNLRLDVEMTGSLDTPAGEYLVTASDESAEDSHISQRSTADLDELRAWVTAWVMSNA